MLHYAKENIIIEQVRCTNAHQWVSPQASTGNGPRLIR